MESHSQATAAGEGSGAQLSLEPAGTPPPGTVQKTAQGTQDGPAEPAPDAPRPILEELVRPFLQRIERAAEDALQRIERATEDAIAAVTRTAREEVAATAGRLATSEREARLVIRQMEELLTGSVAFTEKVTREFAALQAGMVKGLGELIEAVKAHLQPTLDASAVQRTRLETTTTALTAKFEATAKRLAWRQWLLAISVALAPVLILTLLRPGWTMDRDQRTAIRVGQAVIYTYTTASEAERDSIRRAMHWRAPEQPSSRTVPPPARGSK